MSLLLFLIVFVINYNYGISRPLLDDDLNLISNGLEGYDDDRMIFKIPTEIRQGTSILINGTLNKNNTMFRVTLGDSDTDTDNCNINVNFETGDITVTPATKDYGNDIYDLQEQEGEQSKFSLTIIARTDINGNEKLAIFFQVDDAGESNQLICDIQEYENINYIEMEEGVSHVDSLLFEFKEDR